MGWYLNYLPFAFFCLILMYLYKRDKTIFSFSGFVIIIYTVSFLLSIFLDNALQISNYKDFSSWYFIIMCFLFIMPFTKIRGGERLKIQANERLIYQISQAYIVLGFVAILFYLPASFISLSGNLRDNRILSGESAFVSIYGIVPLFMSLIANSFVVNLFFYFFSLYSNWPKKTSNLLLISSLSFVLQSLAWVGRDGIVLWGLTYLSYYFLFRLDLSKVQKKKLKLKLYIISLPALIVLVLITFSRFSDAASYKYNPLLAVADYGGQQYRNFSLHYNASYIEYSNNITNGTNAILRKLGIEMKPNSDIKEGNELYMQKEFQSSMNVFATFIGTFLNSFGKIMLVLIGISWFVVFSLFKRFNKVSTLFIYTFFYQIVLHGLFYYRLGLGYSDLVIYEVLILYFIIKRNESIVINVR